MRQQPCEPHQSVVYRQFRHRTNQSVVYWIIKLEGVEKETKVRTDLVESGLDSNAIKFAFGSGQVLDLQSLCDDLGGLRLTLTDADAQIAMGRRVCYRIDTVSYVPGNGEGVLVPEIRSYGNSDGKIVPAITSAQMLVKSLGMIERKEPTRSDLDTFSLMQLQNRSKRLNGSIEVRVMQDLSTLSKETSLKITEILGPDLESHGTLIGKLQKLNIHASTRRAWLFPEVGPSRVEVKFEQSLRNDIVQSVDKLVKVTGKIRYKPFNGQPYLAVIEALEVLNQESFILAPLSAPSMTRSEETIRESRNAW